MIFDNDAINQLTPNNMDQEKNKQILRKIVELHSKFVVPLFGMKGKDIFLRGTGFFVSRGSDHYLITANHVFDKTRFPGPVYIWCKEYLLTPVRGLQINTVDDRNDDQEDVMVVKLESNFPFPPFQGNFKTLALDYSSLLPENVPRSDWGYLLIGFPESKNEFKKGIEEFNANLYGYDDFSATEQKYDLLKIDPRKYLLIKFDKRRTIEKEGKKYSFPKTIGMSGGPIFLLRPDLQVSGGYRIAVAGIMTRIKKNASAIQGTDISVAIELIEKIDYAQNYLFN